MRVAGRRITYTTIQNWSNNVFNLVTKRAAAYDEAHVEWIDGNIGSRLTMKYPAVYLMGPKASGEVLSVAYAETANTKMRVPKWFTQLQRRLRKSYLNRYQKTEEERPTEV